jgi:hypothetical protein
MPFIGATFRESALSLGAMDDLEASPQWSNRGVKYRHTRLCL